MDLSNFPIIYSRRRTIAITVKRDGSLVVRAPKFAGERRVRQFVESKKAWIEQALIKARRRQPPKKEFLHGEKFLYLGNEFVLEVGDEYRRRLVFEENKFLISKFFLHKAKEQFKEWYKQRALAVCSERAALYAKLMNLRYKKISIKNAWTQWGSCSTLGNLNFSARLVLAPLEIVDYVVVHELAHLAHHNHSRSFWGLVTAHYPAHKHARKWLNSNGHHLVV